MPANSGSWQSCVISGAARKFCRLRLIKASAAIGGNLPQWAYKPMLNRSHLELPTHRIQRFYHDIIVHQITALVVGLPITSEVSDQICGKFTGVSIE